MQFRNSDYLPYLKEMQPIVAKMKTRICCATDIVNVIITSAAKRKSVLNVASNIYCLSAMAENILTLICFHYGENSRFATSALRHRNYVIITSAAKRKSVLNVASNIYCLSAMAENILTLICFHCGENSRFATSALRHRNYVIIMTLNQMRRE